MFLTFSLIQIICVQCFPSKQVQLKDLSLHFYLHFIQSPQGILLNRNDEYKAKCSSENAMFGMSPGSMVESRRELWMFSQSVKTCSMFPLKWIGSPTPVHIHALGDAANGQRVWIYSTRCSERSAADLLCSGSVHKSMWTIPWEVCVFNEKFKPIAIVDDYQTEKTGGLYCWLQYIYWKFGRKELRGLDI